MSLKNKFKNKLSEAYPGMGSVSETTPMAQGSSVTNPPVQNLPKGAGAESATKAGNATSLSPSSGGRDAKPHAQGSSVTNPATEDIEGEETGKKAEKKVSKAPVPTNKGAGPAINFTTTGDARSVINQASSKGNVTKEETEFDDDFISEDEFNALTPEEQAEYEIVEMDEDLTEEDAAEEVTKESFTFDSAVLFEGDDTLTEEFKTKAAGIFEAVVAARIADLREEIENEVTELATEAFAEQVSTLVDALDEYLDVAVNTWLEQNEVAVESGLRTEITENFIVGLKSLFESSYIEVPEDKIDLIGELQDTVEDLTAQLEEQSDIAGDILVELYDVQRERVLDMVSEGLALTQADKLRSLTEDVTFEDMETFTAKITAIRENFFNSRPELKEAAPVNEQPTNSRIAEIAKLMPTKPTF